MNLIDFNFGDICRLEPQLGELFHEALARKTKGIKGNHIWYKEFKPRMVPLVGMMSKNKSRKLKTTDAYEIAYHTIYNALVG